MIPDTDQPCRGFFGYTHCDAIRAAHQDLRVLAIDKHFGRSRGVWTKISAGQLDLAQGQGGSGHHVVNARVGESFSGL
jgi:hypothetical protein